MQRAPRAAVRRGQPLPGRQRHLLPPPLLLLVLVLLLLLLMLLSPPRARRRHLLPQHRRTCHSALQSSALLQLSPWQSSSVDMSSAWLCVRVEGHRLVPSRCPTPLLLMLLLLRRRRRRRRRQQRRCRRRRVAASAAVVATVVYAVASR